MASVEPEQYQRRSDLSDLFNKPIRVSEDKPPISDTLRQLDIADNMKRHAVHSINYGSRGHWNMKNRRQREIEALKAQEAIDLSE